ncbi:MAG: FprA family A-type flavoprotein, partial [Muribaculaceae bacterium]|nr:FprA family A-type flavoprotein [Muribaculaceae bacterium]
MLKLKENIYYVGAVNPNLRVFDIIMKTDFGTTYNAYLIRGDKTALVETVHDRYRGVMMDNIREICDPKEIDYVIFNHTEPDHSGSVDEIIGINPEVVIVGSAAAIKNVAGVTNGEFKSMAVKNGDTLDLGQGLVLEFISAPNLHWPDSIFSYLPARKTVFTCDFLGSHYCEPLITDDVITYPQEYAEALAYYYAAIFGPFPKFVRDGLAKLEKLDFDMACCSHGPVLKNTAKDVMAKYAEWSAPKDISKTATVLYVSAYGYTEAFAERYAAKLNSLGISAKCYNIIKHDPAEISAAVANSAGLVFGSPTINRDALKPVWDVLSGVSAITDRGKPYAVFGSYGWSGEACGPLESRCEGLGLKKAHDPY